MRRQVSECGHKPARSGRLVAVSIDVNPVVDVGEWQAYVERHPDSSLFHLPQWKTVLDESFPHKPTYVFARDTGGHLCGLFAHGAYQKSTHGPPADLALLRPYLRAHSRHRSYAVCHGG